MKLFIYEFSYTFDIVLYQFLEKGTSDITFMGRDQELKWLAFSLCPLFPLQSLWSTPIPPTLLFSYSNTSNPTLILLLYLLSYFYTLNSTPIPSIPHILLLSYSYTSYPTLILLLYLLSYFFSLYSTPIPSIPHILFWSYSFTFYPTPIRYIPTHILPILPIHLIPLFLFLSFL